MKDSIRDRASLRLASCFCAALLLANAGCGGNGSSEPPKTAAINATYYEYLRTSTSVRSPDAQVAVPASGEFFSENTRHFDLVPATGATAASLKAAHEDGFAVYMPAGAKSVSKGAAAGAAAVGAGIPGFSDNAPPDRCLAMADLERLVCLDEARRKKHFSYHDSDSLAIELGPEAPGSLAGLAMRSLASHLGAADMAAIAAGLTRFAHESPEHAAFDAAQHDIFSSQGYAFSHAAITDDSRGDVNGDGLLEPHSTLILEVRKSLQYDRRASPALDACVAAHSTAPFSDAFAVKVDMLVHLDHLKAFRREVTFPVADLNDPNERRTGTAMQRADAIHAVRAVNHAWDANLLRHMSGFVTVPWSATEYMIHLQLQPEVASKYAAVIDAAQSAGDAACVTALRSHLEAHTAFVTGPGSVSQPVQGARRTRLFYQVPEWTGGRRQGPCLRDESGTRVAILDPASGMVIQACEGAGAPAAAKFTEAGACHDDQGNWAYWPSRARTPRFFTSQLILTEMLMHGQVADYWGIQWYQDGWKAAGQVVIRGAGFLISTYLKIQTGQLPSIADLDQAMALRIGVYFVNTFLPTVINAALRPDTEIGIAGYSLKIPIWVSNFALGLASAAADNPTFLQWAAGAFKGTIISFAIDLLTSTVGQLADSVFFGWQDWSNGSHPGCFNFR